MRECAIPRCNQHGIAMFSARACAVHNAGDFNNVPELDSTQTQSQS